MDPWTHKHTHTCTLTSLPGHTSLIYPPPLSWAGTHAHKHTHSHKYTCTLTHARFCSLTCAHSSNILQCTLLLAHSPTSAPYPWLEPQNPTSCTRMWQLLTLSLTRICAQMQTTSHILNYSPPASPASHVFLTGIHLSWGQDRHVGIILLLHYFRESWGLPEVGARGRLLNVEGLLLWGNSEEEGGKKDPQLKMESGAQGRGLQGSAETLLQLSLVTEFIFSLSFLTSPQETDSHSCSSNSTSQSRVDLPRVKCPGAVAVGRHSFSSPLPG